MTTKELIKHFEEITKEYHQHCEWTNEKYKAKEEIIERLKELGELKGSENNV